MRGVDVDKNSRIMEEHDGDNLLPNDPHESGNINSRFIILQKHYFLVEQLLARQLWGFIEELEHQPR